MSKQTQASQGSLVFVETFLQLTINTSRPNKLRDLETHWSDVNRMQLALKMAELASVT